MWALVQDGRAQVATRAWQKFSSRTEEQEVLYQQVGNRALEISAHVTFYSIQCWSKILSHILVCFLGSPPCAHKHVHYVPPSRTAQLSPAPLNSAASCQLGLATLPDLDSHLGSFSAPADPQPHVAVTQSGKIKTLGPQTMRVFTRGPCTGCRL